jgi:esterase
VISYGESCQQQEILPSLIWIVDKGSGYTEQMQLHYRLQGQGPTIVLLHGLFGSLDNLGVLARDLQRDYTVLSLDLRNHGRSPHGAEMNYTLMVQDLVALLQALSLPPVILLGHSMGGKVSMAMALLASQWIKQLLVLDIAPVAYTHQHHDLVFKGIQAVVDAEVVQRQAAVKILRALNLKEATLQFLLKSFYQGQWRFNWPVLQGCYSAVSGWDIAGSWEGPTCFIGGQYSDYLLSTYHAQLRKQFPRAVIHRLPQAGHWLASEQPERVLQIVRKFVAAVPEG